MHQRIDLLNNTPASRAVVFQEFYAAHHSVGSTHSSGSTHSEKKTHGEGGGLQRRAADKRHLLDWFEEPSMSGCEHQEVRS
jgi:hypothetical protein